MDRKLMIFMIAATWPYRIKKLKNIYSNDTKNGHVPDGKPSNSLQMRIGRRRQVAHLAHRHGRTLIATTHLALRM